MRMIYAEGCHFAALSLLATIRPTQMADSSQDSREQRMAKYGRLEIHEPAGAVKSYRIAQEATTVGRAADNAIVIDDPAVSDRHCRLQVLAGTVHIVNLDASAGILLNGAPLRDNTPRPLREMAELALGKTKILFYPSGGQATLPMRAISENTQPIRTSFHVDLEKSVLDVFPASSSSLEIAISNRSGKETRFAIDVEGLPQAWAKLSQTAARLVSDETAYVILSVAPPRRADLKPGDYPATIVIRAQNSADADTLVSLLVRLHGFGGLSLAVEPALVSDRETTQLFMLNQGNEDLRLAVSARDATNQLDIDLAERVLQLAAGQRGILSCRVAARNRPLVGKSREVPFALLVRADNDCAYLAAMPASAMVKPRLSIGAAVILIAAFALSLFAWLSRAPEPIISAFEISAAQVARGTPVDLTWQASFAQRFVIEIDRVAIAELSSDASFYTLATDDYADPIEVALIAVAGEARAIEKRQLDLYQPVTITTFEADRQQMFRKVEGELVLTWRAEGAVSSDMRFPAQFKLLSEEDIGEGVRRLVLRGVPETDFDLILALQDEIGTSTEAHIRVKTADPECAPLRDLPLFAGPDRLYNQTELALSNVPVLVLGSAASKDWMLVELASGETGWGPRSDFFCAGFDPTALTVITDLPQLPTAAPTETAEPTLPPTPTAVSTSLSTQRPRATSSATEAEA